MMQTAQRIILSVLAVLLLSIALLGAIIRFSGLPLGFVAEPINLFLRQSVGGGAVDIEKARLSWNPTANFFEITASTIRVAETSGAGLVAEQASVTFSRDAFWREGRFALQAATIERLFLQQDRRRNLPDAVELIIPTVDGGGGTGALAYISEIAIRDIRVGDYETAQSNGSHVLVLREDNRLSVTIQLDYESDGVTSAVEALADIKDDGSGHANIELNRLDPRDIGRFSALLSPLRGVQLPVTALMGIDFAVGGAPSSGTIELFIEPGAVNFTAADLSVSEMTLSAVADFTKRRFDVNDVRFNIGGVAGRMSGEVGYTQSARGQISEIAFNLSGEGIQANLPKLFAQQLNIPRAEISAIYDLSSDRVDIEKLDVTHNFGTAQTTGQVTLQDRNPYFDLTTRFGKMTRAGTEGLWPLPISPNTRKWVKENVTGGALADGALVLNASLEEMIGRKVGTPMREDALLLDLTVENVALRYLAHLPPLENSDVRLLLRGTSFEAKAKGGLVRLPSLAGPQKPSDVAIEKVRFFLPDYRDRLRPADITVSGTGEVSDIVRAINLPPLNAVKEVDFDFDRLVGKAYGETHLNVAIFAPPAQRELKFKVTGRTDDIAVTGKLGPFSLAKGRGFIDINNAGLHAMGRGEVNGVDGGFAWQQPFAKEGVDKSKLAVHGRFTPQDIADLDQAWIGIRLKHAPHVNLLVNGPIEKPDNFRVYADLTEAEMSMLPLAYVKPKGEAAHVTAFITNDEAGDVEDISATLSIKGKPQSKLKVSLDGDFLTRFEMTPWSLGRDKNVNAKVELIDDTRIISLTADALDVSKLFAPGNREVKYEAEPFEILPFLGPEAVANVQIARALGDNKVEMDNARMRVLRKNNMHEKLSFQGVFADGSDMVMSIERDNAARRNFVIQADRAGNIFRMFDWLSEMYGGNLVAQGSIFDEGFNGNSGPKDLQGRVTMTGFRARNVPVLASILSLASLTGIADTLSGDGIKFDKAQGNFSLANGRLNIDGGRMHGAAVGLTVHGDYDIGLGDVDMGGTLVPAYSINSLIGKIPLVGPMITGRKGEGIIGIGYRVSGKNGKANVLVNPLSVLTPGFLRRIFELGIGLGERGEEINTDLDETDLSE